MEIDAAEAPSCLTARAENAEALPASFTKRGANAPPGAFATTSNEAHERASRETEVMMNRAKVGILCMLAALVLAAVAASSASALEWLTGGTSLFSKATKSETMTAKAETAAELTSTLNGGAKVVILCGAVKFNAATIKEAAAKTPTDNAKAVEYTECKVDEPAACTTTAAITTQEVNSKLFEEELVKGTKEVWDIFEPVGTEFVTIKVSGAECSGEGAYKVTGKACAKNITNADAKTVLWEFGEPLAECALKFGVNSAKLKGIAEISSSTAATWGADL